MKKTFLAPALCAALLAGVLTGCGSTANTDSDTMAAAQEQSKDTTDYSKVASSADMSSVQAVGEDGMEAVSGKQVKDGTYSVSVDCSSKMFHVTDCQLTVKDGKMTAVMTMSGTGYRCIYLGTGEQASKAKPEDYIFPDTNKEGKDTFVIPVEALDKGISCAAFSKNKQQWYDRTILLRADSLPDGRCDGRQQQDGCRAWLAGRHLYCQRYVSWRLWQSKYPVSGRTDGCQWRSDSQNCLEQLQL